MSAAAAVVESVDPRFADTVGVVEATSFERTTLWSRHAVESGGQIRWEEDLSGLDVYAGELDGIRNRVVCWWARLNGKLVLFWEPLAVVVDYRQIEAHFDQLMPHLNRSGGRHFVDALNFGTTIGLL